MKKPLYRRELHLQTRLKFGVALFKMYWQVRISEQIYQISGPYMFVCRLFGLFPVTLRKEDGYIYWKWSPFYTLYSVFVASLLAALSYRGILEDILCDRTESVRIKVDMDAYVVFSDLSGIHVIMVFGIFVSIFKTSKFFFLVKCLREIDAIIPLKHTISARRKSICIIFIILSTTITMSTADIIMYYKTVEGIARSKISTRYFTVYIAYCVVLMTQCRFWHLGSAVLRRLTQLNKNIERFDKDDDATKFLSRDYVISITTVYMKLYEATNSLNQFLGMLNTVTILDILWHFVEAPYHLLSEIIGPRKDAVFISMMAAWNVFHFSRLLILVEPCHSCKLEVQKMKRVISRLLYYHKISPECKFQFQVFSTLLDRCPLRFTAAGLTEIDRSLITTIVGTVSTYLVVLMQYHNRY